MKLKTDMNLDLKYEDIKIISVKNDSQQMKIVAEAVAKAWAEIQTANIILSFRTGNPKYTNLWRELNDNNV